MYPCPMLSATEYTLPASNIGHKNVSYIKKTFYEVWWYQMVVSTECFLLLLMLLLLLLQLRFGSMIHKIANNIYIIEIYTS